MIAKNGVRCCDLFCGGGGSSCGARAAGAVPVGGVDLWRLATETYSLNFPDASVFTAPIGELSPRRIYKEIGAIGLLLASPECTSHSVAKGSAPRDEASRQLSFEVLRFAEAWRPRWVVVENVVQMEQWGRFGEWLCELRGLGYQTRVCKLDAQSFGVPQSRRRLFVMADRLREPAAPREQRGLPKSARTILRDGPPRGEPWKLSPVEGPRRAEATVARAKRAIDAIGDSEPFLMVYYGTDGAGGWQRLDRPLRTITTLDRFALVTPNGKGHVMRMLQPPELAAAMGFPKSYNWPTTARRNKIRLIGNAVCPPVMSAVVKALIDGV